jgi:hypothetical protein
MAKDGLRWPFFAGIAWIAAAAGVIYVVVHFVLKYW